MGETTEDTGGWMRHADLSGLWLFLFLTACVLTCGWSPHCNQQTAVDCKTEGADQ